MIQSYTSQQFNAELISFFSERSISLLYATLAIGFLTMSVIEYLKPYYRLNFHRIKMNTWLLQGYRSAHRPPSEGDDAERDSASRANRAMEELVKLSTAGDERALFSLQLEQLCGQLALGVQSALESPQRYRSLLTALIAYDRQSSDEEMDLDLFISRNAYQDGYYQEEHEERMNRKKMDYIAARNRISNHIQRRIDAYQITTAGDWKTRIRTAAFAIATALSLSIAYSLTTVKTAPALIIMVLTVGYLAAFTAGIFRDITALIEKYRK